MLKRKLISPSKFVIIIVLFIMISLTGCSRTIERTYVAKDGSPTPFLELKSNGTFYFQSVRGGGSTGNYELEDKTITLNWQNGRALKATLQDDDTLLMEGFSYIKKE